MTRYHRKNLAPARLLLLALLSIFSAAGCAAPREATPRRDDSGSGERESLSPTASWCSPICDDLTAPPGSELYRLLRRLHLLP